MFCYHDIDKLDIAPLTAKKIGFVIGTGRCGTQSFSYLLNNQLGVVSEHEIRGHRCSWEFNDSCLIKNLIRLYGLAYVSKSLYLSVSVGFYFLSYIEMIINKVPGVKVICLSRNKNEVIESWIRKAKSIEKGKSVNWWTRYGSKEWIEGEYIGTSYNKMFPSFDLPRREAIGKYWELYFQESLRLQKVYSKSFKTYKMKDVLKNEDAQKEALLFIGVKKDSLKINTNIIVDKLG